MGIWGGGRGGGDVGSSDGAGNLSMPGLPTVLDNSRTEPTALAADAGWVVLNIFLSLNIFISFFLSLGDAPKQQNNLHVLRFIIARFSDVAVGSTSHILCLPLGESKTHKTQNQIIIENGYLFEKIRSFWWKICACNVIEKMTEYGIQFCHFRNH